MHKFILFLAIFSFTSLAFGQQKKELQYNKETNLIEAIYYHENGQVSQSGTFNLDRKLHGEWISFNDEGHKIASGNYLNGKKSGKWLFWSGSEVKEVAYEDNAIASVNGMNAETSVVRN